MFGEDHWRGSRRFGVWQEKMCAKEGTQPPPEKIGKLEPEEAWEGGPGFNVALANLTLNAQLRYEQCTGIPYTLAAVGDGSWDHRQNKVSRAALLHTGDTVGGALDTADLVGGTRNNYDGELTHRVDVLACSAGERLFYIFDSTSPVLASEHFRRASTAARARFQCDDWLGSAMAYEDRMHSVTYWWSKSHIGHLPEAAVDHVAKRYLAEEPTPVPRASSRHVSVRFYAKGSERDYMLSAAMLSLVRREMPLGDAIRPRGTELDALRGAKLCEQDYMCVLQMRNNHSRLQASKAYPCGSPLNAGSILRLEGCPCGGGPQDRVHLAFSCGLAEVRRVRQDELLPAAVLLMEALDATEKVTLRHAVCGECVAALQEDRTPGAVQHLDGTYVVNTSAADMQVQSVVVLLGVVQPGEPGELAKEALRAARPVMRAMISMQRAAEHASRPRTQAAIGHSMRLHKLKRSLDFLRAWTWLHPRESGGPCIAGTLTAIPACWQQFQKT